MGIFQRGFGDKIDLTPEESLQRLTQRKIGRGITAGRHRLEFDEKVDIAARGIEAIIRCGAE